MQVRGAEGPKGERKEAFGDATTSFSTRSFGRRLGLPSQDNRARPGCIHVSGLQGHPSCVKTIGWSEAVGVAKTSEFRGFAAGSRYSVCQNAGVCLLYTLADRPAQGFTWGLWVLSESNLSSLEEHPGGGAHLLAAMKVLGHGIGLSYFAGKRCAGRSTYDCHCPETGRYGGLSGIFV